MTFEEMFFYGMSGIGLILLVTVGLGAFVIWKAMHPRG